MIGRQVEADPAIGADELGADFVGGQLLWVIGRIERGVGRGGIVDPARFEPGREPPVERPVGPDAIDDVELGIDLRPAVAARQGDQVVRPEPARAGPRARRRLATARDRATIGVAREHPRADRRRIGRIGAVGEEQFVSALAIRGVAKPHRDIELLVGERRRPGQLAVARDRTVATAAIAEIVVVAAELEVPARVIDRIAVVRIKAAERIFELRPRSEQLHFLGERFIIIVEHEAHQIDRRAVEIGEAARLHRAPRGDRAQGQVAERAVPDIPVERQRMPRHLEIGTDRALRRNLIGAGAIGEDIGPNEPPERRREGRADRADREHRRRALVVADVISVTRREIARRFPQDIGARGDLAHPPEIAPRRGIVPIAALIVARIAELDLDVADRGQIDADAALKLVPLAVAQPDLAAELAGRLLRDEVDRAADRILAVERALRAAQHLDPLQIDGIERRAGRFRDRHAVEIEPDRLIAREAGIRRRREPAHRDHRTEAVADRLVDLDIGDHRLRIVDGLHPGAFERRVGQSGHRDRHVDQPLFAALRGHHDIGADRAGLRLIGFGGCGLRLRDRGRRGRSQTESHQFAGVAHSSPSQGHRSSLRVGSSGQTGGSAAATAITIWEPLPRRSPIAPLFPRRHTSTRSMIDSAPLSGDGSERRRAARSTALSKRSDLPLA